MLAIAGALLAACTPTATNSEHGGSGAPGDAGMPSDGGSPPGSGSAAQPATLYVYVDGSGTVSSSPAGITCSTEGLPSDCVLTTSGETAVTLTATADAGQRLAGWGGECSGTSPTCSFELVPSPLASEADATFVPISTSLAVLFGGAGSGRVTSTPAGIACASDDGTPCTANLLPGTSVTLTATPDDASLFLRWGGGCSGSATTCSLTIGSDLTTVDAYFEPTMEPITVHTYGAGVIRSSPGSLDCDSSVSSTGCSELFPWASTVTLTATPDAGQEFAWWGESCTGAGSSCTFQVSGPAELDATFMPVGETLTVVLAGNGTGEVLGSASACSGGQCIHCSTDYPGYGCSTTDAYGTVITFTASPEGVSTFGGWSGPCSGTGPCTVTLDQATTLTATFDAVPEQVTVSVIGSGAGTVTAPGLIDCGTGGSECTATVDSGSDIVLTATPTDTSTFVGWAGACHGTNPVCSVSPVAATSVTAEFEIKYDTLTITAPYIYDYYFGYYSTPDLYYGTVDATLGDGTEALFCYSDQYNNATGCSAQVPAESTITLTPTPDSSASFRGWTSGPCTGSGACTFVMSGSTTVGVEFVPSGVSVLTIDFAGGSNANDEVSVVGDPYVLATCTRSASPCQVLLQTGSTIALEASVPEYTAEVFNEWTGGCSTVSSTCDLTISADTSVTAGFE